MKLYTFLISNPAALIMFLIIQTAQAFHTGFVLHDITSLPGWMGVSYAVCAAIGIELIIVFLVGRGRARTATKYKYFYFVINAYAYHLHPDVYFIDVEQLIVSHFWWESINITGFFVLLPAYFLPLSGEELAKELTQHDPTKPKRVRRTNSEIAADKKRKKKQEKAHKELQDAKAI